jgi:AcrR family transcriptional regulator
MPRDQALNAKLRAESRAQILVAARRLFAERGYFNCKVKDIAQEAGMSTGNVYWYFEGKDDVLKAVLAEGFEAQAEVLTTALGRSGSFRQKLEALLDHYIELCREQSEFATIFVSLLGHSGMQFFHELGFDTAQIGAHYHEALAKFLQQGQVQGAVLDLSPQLLVMFFFSFFNGLMITYGEDWLDCEPTAIKRAVLRLVCGSSDSAEAKDA